MTTTRGQVMVAWPSPMTCSAPFAASLVQSALDPALRPRLLEVVWCPSGPLLAATRNAIADRLLSSPAEWLLTVDSDMTFTPADILTLLDAADPQTRPIIGALYVGTGIGVSEVMAEAGCFRDGQIRYLNPRSPGVAGLLEVDFVGAGFCLVHRTVYERLAELHPRPQPWYAEAVRDGRVDGEDWEFCRRATEAGIPVHVHADVRVGHLKTVVLRPEGVTLT